METAPLLNYNGLKKFKEAQKIITRPQKKKAPQQETWHKNR